MLIGTKCGRVHQVDSLGTPVVRFGVAGPGWVTSIGGSQEGRVGFANSLGVVTLQGFADELDIQEFSFGEVFKEEVSSSSCVDLEGLRAFAGSKGGKIYVRSIDGEVEEEGYTLLAQVQCEALKRLRLEDSKLQVYARDAQFRVLDAETGKEFFLARNSKGDELNVVPKPNFVDGKLLDDSTYLVLSTRKLSLFDPRQQRRAVWDLPAPVDSRDTFTVLGLSANEYVSGGNLGELFFFDQKVRKLRRVLKAHNGAVVSLDHDASTGVWASVGRDRMMHYTEASSRETVFSKFLSQTPTCAIRTGSPLSIPEPEEEEIDDLDSQAGDEPLEAEPDPEEEKKKLLKAALKDERLLWHNNVRLPYEKKVKTKTTAGNE